MIPYLAILSRRGDFNPYRVEKRGDVSYKSRREVKQGLGAGIRFRWPFKALKYELAEQAVEQSGVWAKNMARALKYMRPEVVSSDLENFLLKTFAPQPSSFLMTPIWGWLLSLVIKAVVDYLMSLYNKDEQFVSALQMEE